MSEAFPPIHPDEGQDNNINDYDSAIGSLGESSTETLSSWMYQYRKENGRTYHAFEHEKYWGPNDEQAQDHLDLAHHLFTLTFDGKLYLAPVPSNLSTVLDIGTGTGIWAIDFADEHPNAVIIGTDLSPIQPTWVPPSLKFEVDDCEAEWTYPDEYFDFIHIRCLSGCIKDWHRLYAQAMRCLKPTGYIEQTEYAPVSREQGDPPEKRYVFGDATVEAHIRMGRTNEVMYHMYDWMHDAGFEDILEKRYQWPLGPWPRDPKLKELGVWARAHADAGLENWSLAPLTGVLGWSYEQVQVHIAMARQALWRQHRHLLQEMRVVYGRKPRELEKGSSGASVHPSVGQISSSSHVQHQSSK